MQESRLSASQASAIEVPASQELLSDPTQNRLSGNSSWWDPHKRKASRVVEGASEQCDNFVVRGDHIFVLWPSGELTATNYPSEYLKDNQIRRIGFQSASSSALDDPDAESDEDARLVLKKKNPPAKPHPKSLKKQEKLLVP